MTVWLSEDYTRAAPGGTGEAKCAGNYAASLVAQAQAAEHGCDQVVWLDAVEHRCVEEMGGMNLFFVYGSGANARLVTPALTGSAAAGRHPRLAAHPRRRPRATSSEAAQVSTDEWREGNASGEITEVFACGTAAVITPVGAVRSAEHELDGRRRRDRPGDRPAAPGPAGHPDRGRRRPARLAVTRSSADPAGPAAGPAAAGCSGRGLCETRTVHRTAIIS